VQLDTFLFLSPRRAVSQCHGAVTILNVQLDTFKHSGYFMRHTL